MSSNKRHQPCGADNRKKKNKKGEEAKSQKNGLLRYFKKSETLDTFVENNDEQEQHGTSREDNDEQEQHIEVLDFLQSVHDFYPNSSIANRILLTIPVSVASAERSFSKLKLIKSYLRSTMSQERLSDLAILSIERELLRNIDFESLVNEFLEKKGRQIMF